MEVHVLPDLRVRQSKYGQTITEFMLLSLLVVSQTTKQLGDKIFCVTTLTEFFLLIVTNLECNSAPFKYLSQVWKRNPVIEECIVRVKVGIISRCS